MDIGLHVRRAFLSFFKRVNKLANIVRVTLPNEREVAIVVVVDCHLPIRIEISHWLCTIGR